jgi:small subunit ribosomal protein S17
MSATDDKGTVGKALADQGAAETRARRKVVRGQVTSNKMQKTLVVEVRRKVRHPLYEKYVSKRTKLYVHDEKNEALIGDVVEVMQTRPLSALKRWRLVRIVQRATQA